MYALMEVPLMSGPGNSEQRGGKASVVLPYRRNLFFTGREESLRALREGLVGGGVAAISQVAAISGLGGIGKTQVALEYAYRFEDSYRAVLWVQAEDGVVLRQGLVGLAGKLGLAEAGEADQDLVVAAVKSWLEREVGWLLVLDNVTDLGLVEGYLPVRHGGHVLLTTRLQAVGGLGRQVVLRLPSEAEGALQLLRRAGLVGPEGELEAAGEGLRLQAVELVRELGCLPLALDHAGAYIEKTRLSVERYLGLYRERGREVRKQQEKHSGGAHDSVGITFSLALERVERDHVAAGDLIRGCAFLASEGIPEELFTQGGEKGGQLLGSVATDAPGWEAVVGAVCDYALLTRDGEGRRLSIQRLVQALVRDGMEAETRRAWAERVVRAIARMFPAPGDPETWYQGDRLVRSALVGAGWIEREGLEFGWAALMLNRAGDYLSERAQYAVAEPLFVRGLAIYEKVKGAEHPATAIRLNALALFYTARGNYAAAEPLAVRALAIREKVLGAEHSETLDSLNDLASLYQCLGNYARAEALYGRVLAIREKVLGVEHPDTATSLNNLAVFYESQGNYVAAEPLLVRVLAIREKVLGMEHPDTATSLNDLAYFYFIQGNYAQAEGLYWRAMVFSAMVLGAEHPDTAMRLNDLAYFYFIQGNYAQAEELFVRALAIFEKVQGAEHPSANMVRENLGMLRRSIGLSEL